MAAPVDPGRITAYHAHIYYDTALAKANAAALRDQVAVHFPEVTLGRWHDERVGPHPRAMYQIAFPTRLFATFVPWLMLNRNGMTILLHPETGDDYTDHALHAAWFGEVLPLRLEMLRK